MIVVLDNRDSFVFNLARHFELLGVPTTVVPSHATTAADLAALAPRALVISPGPCSPAEAGCSMEAVRHLRGRVPILGVCLGHQAIAAALGGRIVRADRLVVAAESLPQGLVVTARDDDGTIMAIADVRNALFGVQFHPESILTRHGFRLLANFLERAWVPHHGRLAPLLDADIAEQGGDPATAHAPPPPGPVVTF
jgi:anthranilate/para-aminobenzoate synthase component II